jgi:hypothetical protein
MVNVLLGTGHQTLLEYGGQRNKLPVDFQHLSVPRKDKNVRISGVKEVREYQCSLGIQLFLPDLAKF